ncbi:MAG: hypothetical protein K2P51_03655 [Rhabdochlamydiaceae bacterium]|nr:hypothetical protein [Rhabdochlamydiaceae bacterium]
MTAIASVPQQQVSFDKVRAFDLHSSKPTHSCERIRRNELSPEIYQSPTAVQFKRTHSTLFWIGTGIGIAGWLALIGVVGATSSFFGSPFLAIGACIVTGYFISLRKTCRFVTDLLVKPWMQRTLKNIHSSIENTIRHSQMNQKKALIIQSPDIGANPQENQIPERNYYPFNGLPYQIQQLPAFKENLERLAKTHAVQRISTRTHNELEEQLKLIPNDSLDYLWVRAHGEKDRIILGKDFVLDHNAKTISRLFRKKMRQNSTIVLESCSTAEGKSNIARRISQAVPQSKVYASKELVFAAHGFFLQPTLVPWFLGTNPKCSRAYQNGKSL